MQRTPRMTNSFYVFALLCSLFALANSSVVARPAKNTAFCSAPKTSTYPD